MTEQMVTVPLALLVQAEGALRQHETTWIALSGRLDQPYPDDPRWSPWTRFALRACRRGERARKALKEAIGHA